MFWPWTVFARISSAAANSRLLSGAGQVTGGQAQRHTDNQVSRSYKRVEANAGPDGTGRSNRRPRLIRLLPRERGQTPGTPPRSSQPAR